ncbi:MAG: flagellar type III secretion system pore protein FliP [Candidatus Eisenbacteria bacterium]
MTFGSAVQTIGALAVTLALLVVALRMVRRIQGPSTDSLGGVALRVLRRVPLGPKQGVALLQVGERVLVVSVAEGGTQLLTELAPEEASRALPEMRGVAASNGVSSTTNAAALPIPAFLRRFARRAAAVVALLAGLSLAAGSAWAQAAPPAPAEKEAKEAVVRAKGALRPAGMTVPKPAPRPAASPSPSISSPSFSVHPPAPPKVELKIGSGTDAVHLDGTVGIVVFLGAMTLLPAIFLLMTSFTRILIVLHFLRSALGTQTTPPNQLLVALAILLTGVVMNPVLQQANREALQPYFAGQVSQMEAYERGVQPLRTFMLANTRDQELALFAELSGSEEVESVEQLPTITIVSAFVTSELRAAFQMGFVIYLPFIVLDLVVASVLMSLGMFMLPPMMVSLPFKLLLFVLADGWTLIVQSLVQSFR